MWIKTPDITSNIDKSYLKYGVTQHDAVRLSPTQNMKLQPYCSCFTLSSSSFSHPSFYSGHMSELKIRARFILSADCLK